MSRNAVNNVPLTRSFASCVAMMISGSPSPFRSPCTPNSCRTWMQSKALRYVQVRISSAEALRVHTVLAYATATSV